MKKKILNIELSDNENIKTLTVKGELLRVLDVYSTISSMCVLAEVIPSENEQIHFLYEVKIGEDVPDNSTYIKSISMIDDIYSYYIDNTFYKNFDI